MADAPIVFAVDGDMEHDGLVEVPAGDVRRLVDQLRREPRGAASEVSPAFEARRVLAQAVLEGRATARPCRLKSFLAWEVLWAIQRLPGESVSEPLAALRDRLLAATGAHGSSVRR